MFDDVTQPARIVRLCGEAEYRDEGEKLLTEAGDAALIQRGRPRSILVKCPDGCGETLVINLDTRAGKAWRLDMRRGRPTLYPSVWRDGGCGSHFIVWSGHILWCDHFARGNVEPEYDEALEERLMSVLRREEFRSVEEIASELEEIPWEVSRAAHRLAQRGLVEAGRGIQRDSFRRG